MRNCPTNVATILNTGSLRLIKRSIDSKARDILLARMAFAKSILLRALQLIKLEIVAVFKGFVCP